MSLQEDIEALQELSCVLDDSPEEDRDPQWQAGLHRAIRIMTALAKLDAGQIGDAIETISRRAAGCEREAAVSENEPGWASEAAAMRALVEALEAAR